MLCAYLRTSRGFSKWGVEGAGLADPEIIAAMPSFPGSLTRGPGDPPLTWLSTTFLLSHFMKPLSSGRLSFLVPPFTSSGAISPSCSPCGIPAKGILCLGAPVLFSEQPLVKQSWVGGDRKSVV